MVMEPVCFASGVLPGAVKNFPRGLPACIITKVNNARYLGSISTLCGRVVFAALGATFMQRLRAARRVRNHGACHPRTQLCAHEDATHELYIRTMVTSVEWIGEQGAIVGLQQLNNIEAPNHFLEVPFEFPLLLDAGQTDAFQFATHGVPAFLDQIDGPLDSLVLCEIVIHNDKEGELVVAEECKLPCGTSDDGLVFVEDSVVKHRRIPVSIGDALAMTMRFSLPVLLDIRRPLEAARDRVDRLRLERLMSLEENHTALSDDGLMLLREDLAAVDSRSTTIAQFGALLQQIKPLAWYWAEFGRRGTAASGGLCEYQKRFAQLQSRQGSES